MINFKIFKLYDLEGKDTRGKIIRCLLDTTLIIAIILLVLSMTPWVS